MSPWFGRETFQPAFDSKPTPLVSYGLHFSEACRKHVKETFKSSRVYIIASGSLSRNTKHLDELKSALGPDVVGVHAGVCPHTPIREIIDILAKVRELDVDCIVTLGAGSITDGAKLIRFAIANQAWTEEEIDTLWGGKSNNPKQRTTLHKPTIPLICIPTSLSGGEYQSIAGATDLKTKAKHTFEPEVDPQLVVQDPELTFTTPEKIWLSTGIRSVDHCVETLCSLQSTESGDVWAAKGLEKLIPGLLGSKKNPKDLAARHLCQVGVMEAMRAVSCGIPLGASHAIGHQLGPLGVAHGETSCILLPVVCKFNARKGANNVRQEMAASILLKQQIVKNLLAAKNLSQDQIDLGDILDLIIRELGMPRSLDAVNVLPNSFEDLAANSLHDLWIKTNAYPITKKEDIFEILEAIKT